MTEKLRFFVAMLLRMIKKPAISYESETCCFLGEAWLSEVMGDFWRAMERFSFIMIDSTVDGYGENGDRLR